MRRGCLCRSRRCARLLSWDQLGHVVLDQPVGCQNSKCLYLLGTQFVAPVDVRALEEHELTPVCLLPEFFLELLWVLSAAQGYDHNGRVRTVVLAPDGERDEGRHGARWWQWLQKSTTLGVDENPPDLAVSGDFNAVYPF